MPGSKFGDTGWIRIQRALSREAEREEIRHAGGEVKKRYRVDLEYAVTRDATRTIEVEAFTDEEAGVAAWEKCVIEEDGEVDERNAHVTEIGIVEDKDGEMKDDKTLNLFEGDNNVRQEQAGRTNDS